MDGEPDLTCPNSGNTMELMTADEAGSPMRVCPACATLAWNGKDGRLEIRQPQNITGETKRKLLENMKFITVEEALADLAEFTPPPRPKNPERLQ